MNENKKYYLADDTLWVHVASQFDGSRVNIYNYFDAKQIVRYAPTYLFTPIDASLDNITTLQQFKDHYPEYFV